MASKNSSNRVSIILALVMLVLIGGFIANRTNVFGGMVTYRAALDSGA